MCVCVCSVTPQFPLINLDLDFVTTISDSHVGVCELQPQALTRPYRNYRCQTTWLSAGGSQRTYSVTASLLEASYHIFSKRWPVYDGSPSSSLQLWPMVLSV